jgi:hypothetical protein
VSEWVSVLFTRVLTHEKNKENYNFFKLSLLQRSCNERRMKWKEMWAKLFSLWKHFVKSFQLVINFRIYISPTSIHISTFFPIPTLALAIVFNQKSTVKILALHYYPLARSVFSLYFYIYIYIYVAVEFQQGEEKICAFNFHLMSLLNDSIIIHLRKKGKKENVQKTSLFMVAALRIK